MAKSWQYLTSLLPFIIAPSPQSERTPARNLYVKLGPPTLFCLPPSLSKAGLLFSVITLKSPCSNVLSARRSFLSQNSWHWHSNFPRAIETRESPPGRDTGDQPWNFPTHDHCRSPEARHTTRPSLSQTNLRSTGRYCQDSPRRHVGSRLGTEQNTRRRLRPHSIKSNN